MYNEALFMGLLSAEAREDRRCWHCFSSTLRGLRPEQRIMYPPYLVNQLQLSESSLYKIQKSKLPTRGMAKDTGLGLPRLGGASAGPGAAAARRGRLGWAQALQR